MLLYHGGSVFGKAENPQSSKEGKKPVLARTMVGVMIRCLLGGPKFLSKMTPTANITAEYLHEQVNVTKSAVESNSGKVAAVIHDNNRINQKFTGMFNTVPGKPWLTEDGTAVLYDTSI